YSSHAFSYDFLHLTPEEERKSHKKRLVQIVLCIGCSTVLCQLTGGKARLTEEMLLREKNNNHVQHHKLLL
uniref:Uncharacterized protein n=1 Tax=Leptobrachium leishanense TaxID=445787 RepID=A0A8C5QSX4_9ANUR